MTNDQITRILEPEVMDSWEEAVDYDAMDFLAVNTDFAQTASQLCLLETAKVLDAGTGTARIPIILGQMHPQWQVWGIDLAENMLKLGDRNVKAAGLEERIILDLADSKQLPYSDEQFDLVISNSLIHHLPDPLPFFLELKRVLKPQGAICIRDLIRPSDRSTIERLVAGIGTQYNDQQKKLFRDSLHAAFTINEIEQLISQAGILDVKIYQSSDRHWTVERSRGAEGAEEQVSNH